MFAPNQLHWLVLNGAALLGCAVFSFDQRSIILIAIMLFFTFLDSSWSFSPRKLTGEKKWLIASIIILLLACIHTQLYHLPITYLIEVLFLTALPEEWFFRAYLMSSLILLLRNKNKSIIITSIFFALLHLPTHGAAGVLIFFPSLFFCWLYIKSNSLLFVATIHAYSNIIFRIYN